MDTSLAPYACGTSYAVDFDGKNYFLAWQDDSVRCKRIAETGATIGSPFVFIANSKVYGLADVCFDGENQLVLLRNKDSLAVAVVTPDAAVKELLTFAAPKQEVGDPAITSPAKGKFAVVYSGWADSVHNRPVYTYRLKGFSYDYLPVPITTIPDTPERFEVLVTQQGCRIFIRLTMPRALMKAHRHSSIQFNVFNAHGRLVTSFTTSLNSTVVWNRMSGQEKMTSNGIYFIRAEVGSYRSVAKMALCSYLNGR